VHLQKLVRQTLAVKDHKIVSVVEAADGSLQIELDRIRRRRLPCSHCGERCAYRDRLPSRCWKHVPLWGIAVTLHYRPCRVTCPHCGVVVEKIPWSAGKSPLTLPLVIVLATWARLLAVDVIARHFGIHWNTVYAAVKAAVADGLAQRDKGVVLHIGIDEISRRKGHIYHTQVYDLDRKVLLWSGEGRSEDTLRRFFDDYGVENLKQVSAVCCDMWKPYATVLAERLPEAVQVFDKFHVIKQLLVAVDEVRRDEAAAHRSQGVTLLKHTRYLLLKNPDKLSDKQQRKLSFLLRLNLDVTKAYVLKEEFRQFWDCDSPGDARRFLRQWYRKAGYSRLKPMQRFVQTLKRHEDVLFNWFEHKISNGIAEALNNSAKAISRRSRGFRTEATFSTLLMHCMGGLTLPHTAHKFV